MDFSLEIFKAMEVSGIKIVHCNNSYCKGKICEVKEFLCIAQIEQDFSLELPVAAFRFFLRSESHRILGSFSALPALSGGVASTAVDLAQRPSYGPGTSTRRTDTVATGPGDADRGFDLGEIDRTSSRRFHGRQFRRVRETAQRNLRKLNALRHKAALDKKHSKINERSIDSR